jgi:UDP-N-acetylglucosamine 2-epimerase
MALSKIIQAVAGDRGGWNAINPLLTKAADEGCAIEVQLVGASHKQVQEGQLKLDNRFKLVDKLQSSAQAVTVLGMSQSVEGIAAIVSAVLVTQGSVIGIQDYYGSALPLLRELKRKDKLEALTLLCVNDAIAEQHIRQPGFDNVNIQITGNPYFDQVAAVKQNWSQRRQEFRNLLALQDTDVLFLVVGQPNGTAEILEMLEAGLAELSLTQPTNILVRMHPRATPENQQAVTEYYQATAYDHFVIMPDTLTLTSDDLLPAADFVLSGYSTTNHFAVLYEMPGVMYVKTPSLQQDLLRDTKLDKPLEVEAGAAWYITQPTELVHAVTEVLASNQSTEVQQIQAKQQEIAQYNNGQASERCWSQVKKLLQQT